MVFRKAQSDAHSELTPNFAAQAAGALLSSSLPQVDKIAQKLTASPLPPAQRTGKMKLNNNDAKQSIKPSRGGNTMHLQIGAVISAQRKTAKVTQQELADFIGVSKASVSKWENGVSQS